MYRQLRKEFFPILPNLSLLSCGVRARPCTLHLVENKETHMSWKTPRVIEVAVGMEINCYACADI